MRESFVLREVYPPVEFLGKSSADQAIHDRAFDFRQMQGDAGIAQPVVDRFEALQSGSVDLIHGRAHQNDVSYSRLRSYTFEHEVLEPTCIEVRQALIDADRQDVR